MWPSPVCSCGCDAREAALRCWCCTGTSARRTSCPSMPRWPSATTCCCRSIPAMALRTRLLDAASARPGRGLPGAARGARHPARQPAGLLVLHRDIGTPDQLPFYVALAERYDLLLPEHPGYGASERRPGCGIRATWRRCTRGCSRRSTSHVPACWAWASAAGSPPRWRAMAPRDFDKLVLVGPMGIKPPQGDILDQALVSHIDYARAGFHDQKAFDGGLRRGAEHRPARRMGPLPGDEFPPRLEALHVQPDLAASAGRRARAGAGGLGRRGPGGADQRRRSRHGGRCRGAKLEVVPDCGACVEMEQPAELARLVTDFIG